MRGSHVPERSCVGCRTKRPKGELIRVVARESQLEVDSKQRLPGRGAYVCHDPGCWKAGVTRGGFARALRVKVPAAARQNLPRVFTMGVE